jgi:soluble lytic murein transglycosylase
MRRIIIAVGIIFIVPAVSLSWLHHHTSSYDYIISQAAARNGLDFHLVKALIYEESWFRPGVKGSAGELGLMQITAAAASDFTTYKGFPSLNENQRMEPVLNVEIGCWYLKQSIERYKDSPHPILFALLRYNAGEKRADAWLKLALSVTPQEGISREDRYLSVVDFPKTRAYAHRILKRAKTHNYWF